MDYKKPFLSALLIFVSVVFANAQNDNFDVVLQNHLDAVTNKNIDGLSATIADDVLLIFPDGDTLQSKEKFINFHIDWFRDSSWKMTTAIINTSKSPTLAYGLVKYHLTKYKTDGNIISQSNTYLLLIFEKRKNKWLLVHDQNTKLNN